MKPSQCPRVKNPCKYCLQIVNNNNGLQCQGACKKWAHFKCLDYTPGKISDIKAGVIEVICPCPDCESTSPKEVLTKPPHTCSNEKCPANRLPICDSNECPSKQMPKKSPQLSLVPPCDQPTPYLSQNWSPLPPNSPQLCLPEPSLPQPCSPQPCPPRSCPQKPCALEVEASPLEPCTLQPCPLQQCPLQSCPYSACPPQLPPKQSCPIQSNLTYPPQSCREPNCFEPLSSTDPSPVCVKPLPTDLISSQPHEAQNGPLKELTHTGSEFVSSPMKSESCSLVSSDVSAEYQCSASSSEANMNEKGSMVEVLQDVNDTLDKLTMQMKYLMAKVTKN